MKKRTVFFLLLATLFGQLGWSQVKSDDIVGYWLTRGQKAAKIQIYKSGDSYYGKIAWMTEATKNGEPRLDKNNPDPAKRNQPILGLAVLSGFQFDGDDEWQNGKIYDPQSGKTYRCYLSLKDKNTLKLRGYIGVSLLGRTEYWTRTTL